MDKNLVKKKVLIVCFNFPPYNVAGSLRLGKIAKYFEEYGLDIKVLHAKDPSYLMDLSVEISKKNVHAVEYFDVNSIPKLFFNQKESKEFMNTAVEALSKWQKIKVKLAYIFKMFAHFPDSRIGWIFSGFKEGKKIIDEWNPNLLYISALPASTAILGYRLAKYKNIPFILEYRDLWTLNHYYYYPKWRKYLEKKIEKRINQSAELLVTVSEPLARDLRKNFDTETYVSINGIDTDTLAEKHNLELCNEFSEDYFNVVYTGGMYNGKRDPSMLFKAIRKYNNSGLLKKQIRVYFYGTGQKWVQQLADSLDISSFVFCKGSVSYVKSVEVQHRADALLLLLWDSPLEEGVFTGKLFEYIPTNNPIIAIGPPSNVGIKLIEREKMGFGTNNQDVFDTNILNMVNDTLSVDNSALIERYSRKYIANELMSKVRKYL